MPPSLTGMARAYGEPNESGNISAASVRHEVCLVRFDRRHTDKKFGRDFLCRHSASDHLQDLSLTRSKPRVCPAVAVTRPGRSACRAKIALAICSRIAGGFSV